MSCFTQFQSSLYLTHQNHSKLTLQAVSVAWSLCYVFNSCLWPLTSSWLTGFYAACYLLWAFWNQRHWPNCWSLTSWVKGETSICQIQVAYIFIKCCCKYSMCSHCIGCADYSKRFTGFLLRELNGIFVVCSNCTILWCFYVGRAGIVHPLCLLFRSP